MIIIIRALSQVRKGWWRLWFPHKSVWVSGLKKRGHKKEGPKQKNERKRESGQYNHPSTTLVLQSSTVIFMIESLSFCHLIGDFPFWFFLFGPFYLFLWPLFFRLESHPDLWGNHSLHHPFLTWDNALIMMIITLLLTYNSKITTQF